MKFNADRDSVMKRATAIRLLLLDVDGILTDGRLYYGPDGESLKAFNTLDGHGIKLLQSNGIEVGIISGRDSQALVKRASELRIESLYRGREDKLAVLNEICSELDLRPGSIAFAGDDLPDLPVMREVGLSFSVPNAHDTVRQAALLETEKLGGDGAVREICDFLLQATGKYDGVIEAYDSQSGPQ